MHIYIYIYIYIKNIVVLSCSCYLEFIFAAEVLCRQYVIKTHLLTCERHSYLRIRSADREAERHTCKQKCISSI